MNKSTLFITAWNMSRDAAAKFGGSVKSYFAESLKLAYGRTRLVTLEACLKVGGKLWEKNGMRRVYFNGDIVAAAVGFEYDTYKTGNVKWACLGDASLANGRANAVRTMIHSGKFWFDTADNKIHARGDECRDLSLISVVRALKAVALAA
ncbi:hypothetical protein HT886_003130 [Salmonella enterica]|uniref:hypothetical protein n=1 Tax=Salmonella enterica TaxID=28901 RepID=UPI00127A0C2E|nr:hypothetical protein [Salmonella enterica]EBV2373541.1 hypothetical protein [Salmonella enterica subsp. enterica serovar Enteritidis]ECH9439097.1 hypothetical protein [Salmonella enterica subsp. enterica serovar Bareilly]ECI4697518.1 hypothetical protein [Salmonella enterica subsp. diarizonae]ECS6774835.1 hypothetical protein [Salmonella enterica subsp. diarizonae serovar 65:z10:e,n,x,z15]EGP3877015.1 hypothetical protein [Salmonella enterica subsp. enterica serovar Durban]EHL2769446.1 hyp